MAGYFYLIRALELEGRFEEAYEFLEDIEFNAEDLIELEERLGSSRNENPQNYWQNLKF